MPLSPRILQRIYGNDPELINLNLERITDGTSSFDTSDAYNLAQALETNTHLQILDLQGHDAQVPGILTILHSLAGNRSLKVLNLRGNHDGSFPLKELLQQLKRTALVWFDCGMATAMTNSPSTPRLDKVPEGLFLRMDRVDLVEDEPFVLSELLEELKDFPIAHLDISGHNLTDEEYPQLAQLLSQPSLTSIYLNRLNLGSEGARYLLKGLQKNEKITRLELEHNQLDDNFIQSLAQWKGISTLKALNLANNSEITETSVLMEKLAPSVIEEISFANNDTLVRNSMLSVMLFLQNNTTCQHLNLARANLYDFMRPLFAELPKTKLVSLNLAYCTLDEHTKEEVDNLMIIMSETLGHQSTLRKLNLTDNFRGYAATEFARLVPVILQNNKGLEELILGTMALPSAIEKSLEHELKSNTHLQVLDVKEFITDSKRLEKMTSILERNQKPISYINQVIRQVEDLLNNSYEETRSPENIHKQIIKYYADAEKFLKQRKKEDSPDPVLQRTLKISAASSFLKLGLPVKAWRQVIRVEDLDGTMWQKITEAFFSKLNQIPSGIKNSDYHLFLLMLLRKTENTAFNRSLLRQVFSSLCKTEQIGTGNETIIYLEEFKQAVRAAKEELESKLGAKPESEEQAQWRKNIKLFACVLKRPFTEKTILNLCKNTYIAEQLGKMLEVNSESIVILEQLIVNKYLQSDSDILDVLSSLEKKIFRKIAHLNDENSALLEISEQKINPPEPQKLLLDNHEAIKNFLLGLKERILQKNWQVRVGEVGVYRDNNGVLVPLGKRIPKGVQQILSAIDEKNEDWLETLNKVHNIAAHHGHYVDVKMFFIGQSLDTQQWYQQLESEVQVLIQRYPRPEY